MGKINLEDREVYLKLNRLERYETALREIARVEEGRTENKAIMLARKTLTAEYLGERFKEDEPFFD